MSDISSSTIDKIAKLNDELRQTLLTGRIIMTCGVSTLNTDIREEALLKLRKFDDFTEDNNPYGERDFGAFKIGVQLFFWKIDYYQKGKEALCYGSEDPSNSDVTDRVLTIMLSEEY